MSAGSRNRFGLLCPHCRGEVATRTSREVTRLARDIYFRCDDLECGHTFVAQLCVTGTLVQSAKPDPNVHLPICPPSMRRAPSPANDNRGAIAVVG